MLSLPGWSWGWYMNKLYSSTSQIKYNKSKCEELLIFTRKIYWKMKAAIFEKPGLENLKINLIQIWYARVPRFHLRNV